MILLRALLNGIIGLVALIAALTGCDRMISAFSPDKTEPALVAWVLGGAVALAVLLFMSNLQRKARQLSIVNLIVQNTLSIAFIVLCLIPVKS